MKNNDVETLNGFPKRPKPSSETFKVPEGFFEGFSGRIISSGDKVDFKHANTGFNWISVAAVFVVVTFSASVIYHQTQKNSLNSEPSADELAHFLVLEGASHEELAQQLIPETMDEFSEENQIDEIYETYLLEQEIDINHLNEEL